MSTLIAITGLGIITLLLEVLNLRKIIVPVVLIGLIFALSLNISDLYDHPILEIDGHGMVTNGKFQNMFNILFIILAGLIITMSPQFYKDRIEKISDFVALKVFTLAGAVAMISFSNLILFFLGLEVLSISIYALASSRPDCIKSNEAGMKYFIMGAVASAFVLFGIALIYGATSTFDVSLISQLISRDAIFNQYWLHLGIVMIFIGMFFKSSIFPFQFWAPDVYEGTPTINTALMSTLVKVAALSSFFLLGAIFHIQDTVIVSLICILGVLTMTIANITALKQKNIKRIMAYSGIAHAGFMVLTMTSIDSSQGTILIYCSAYSIASLITFSVIMSVCQGKANEDISNFYGLFRKKPLLSCMMILALMSLGGVPFLAGFFAKFILFINLINSKLVIVAVLCVINSIIAIYYYFGIINAMFKNDNEDSSISVSKTYYVVTMIGTLLLILLSFIFLYNLFI